MWKELPGGWETQLLYAVFVSIVAGKPEAPLLKQTPNDPCISARVRRREAKMLYEDLVKVARPYFIATVDRSCQYAIYCLDSLHPRSNAS